MFVKQLRIIKTKTMTTITNIAYYYEGECGSNVRLMSMS